MKKYIVSILIASVFLIGAPFVVPKASAADLNIRDFINLLVAIGVITPDKMPAVNAFLATLDTQGQVETVAYKTYVLNDGSGLSESGYTSFMVKYPANWKYKEFSYNVEGIAFCPKSMADCGVGMVTMKSAITIYPNRYDATGSISGNSATHHNFKDANGRILASASLSDLKYQKEFADIISSFQFISHSSQFSINVLSPNGGEIYKKGDTVNIKWDVRNARSNTLTVDLFDTERLVYNLGTMVNPLLGSGNNAPFTWAIPRDGAPGGRTIDYGKYKIRVCRYPDPQADFDCDVSDSYFRIVANDDGSLYPTLDLMEPEINGRTASINGVTYPVSGQIDTTWCKTINPNASGNGPFEFNWNDGNKSCSWFPATHTYATGYQWGESGMYKVTVRVKNTQGLISERYKLITPPAITVPTVTVISPNGGERLKAGDNLNVKWRVTGAENFKGTKLSLIDLYGTNLADLNGQTVTSVVIGNSVNGTNSSNDLGTGPGYNGRYIVKVCLIGNNTATTLCDSSNAYFDLTPYIPAPVVTASLYPVCGSADDTPTDTLPTTNLCAAGEPAGGSGATYDNTNRWWWGCKGYNTNWKDDMTWCFVQKTTPTEVYPVCGTAINTCKVGTLDDHGTTGDGTNRWYWGCKGSNTTWKDDMTWCFAPKTSASTEGQNYATASIGWESLLKLIQALR